MRTATIDPLAISLSSLCVIHCLALPLLAAFLPLAGVIAELEWLHRGLVLIAVPLGLFAYSQIRRPRTKFWFGVFAGLGATSLIAGAFVAAFHDHETLLTTIGALFLAGAHLYRWHNHNDAPEP